MDASETKDPSGLAELMWTHRAAVAQLQGVSDNLEQTSATLALQLGTATTAAKSAIGTCRQMFDDTATALLQSMDVISNAGVPPPPPPHLQKRVVGGYHPSFMSSGDQTIRDLTRILKAAGVDIATLHDVLDFGVGCGRVLRRFSETFPESRLTGADIDAEAIQWLSENYGGRFGDFLCLPHTPPAQLQDDSFDLIYAISIFTHLDEEMQFAWLGELRRIARVGGYVIATVHGEHYINLFPSDQRQEIYSKGIFFNSEAASTEGLPDFYKNTYHAKEYINKNWVRYFRIVSHEEMGCEGHQDLLLLQRTR